MASGIGRRAAWWLAMLWAGLGVAGSACAFVWSLHPLTNSVWGDFIWAGEPADIANAAGLGAIAWLLLTIPVLIAGLVRLFRRKPGDGRVAAWVTTWVMSVLLMFLAAYWAGLSPRTTYPCTHWGHPSWCSFNDWGSSIVICGRAANLRRAPGTRSRRDLDTGHACPALG